MENANSDYSGFLLIGGFAHSAKFALSKPRYHIFTIGALVLCMAGQKWHRPFDLTYMYIILSTKEAAHRPAYENIGQANITAHQA